MDLLLEFLPLLSIMTMGAGSWKLLTYFHPVSLRKTEYFNIFLLLGSFLLIFPLTFIGIQPDGLLQLKVGKAVLQLISFKGYSLLYFLISLVISIIICYYSIKWLIVHFEHFDLKIESLKNYRIILIFLLLLDYLFLELIQPLRGFDALYYYLPEAEVIYQTGRITEINYLSFLPIVKGPLNVLLFVYTKFITGEFAIHLIPFLFLVGIIFLVYDFAMELFDNQSIALMASIFTLTLPFTYWLMNWWAFYQDLYLCYFFSIACYFCLKWYNNPNTRFFGGFLAVSIIIAILTKITAWILPLLFIIWLPTNNQGKSMKILSLFIVGIFLCIQTMTRIYIGNVVPIILVLSCTCFFVINEKRDYNSGKNLIRIIPIFLGVLIGSSWLLNRIHLSSSVWDEISNSYFNISNNIQWNYPIQSFNPLLNTLETVHKINFISVWGILILGSVFVLPWAILKIYALRNYQPLSLPLIWIFLFFAVWLTYYSTNSIRYLAPIIIPMVLCISWGCFNVTKKIDKIEIKLFWETVFIFLGTACFYYLIPIQTLAISETTQETIGFVYNQSALDYYAHPLILALIAFLLILIFYFGTNNELQKRIKGLFTSNNIKIARTLLLCCIIIIPIAVQSYLLIYSNGDINQYHAIQEYEYRQEYKELIEVLIQQNQPFSAILTVRTPGIQFFTGQPVIDIYYQSAFFVNNTIFTSINLTEILMVLKSPVQYSVYSTKIDPSIQFPIKFIVVPSTGNLYYSDYTSNIETNSFLFSNLDISTNFLLIYHNPDFKLYEITH